MWVAYSTDNYQDLTDVWKSTLLEYVAEEKDIRHKIDNISGNYEEAGFQSDLFRDCAVNAMKHLVSQLDKAHGYDYVVLTECDIQYFNNDWSKFLDFIEKDGKSMYIMRENIRNEMNTGWYIIKKSYVNEFKKFLEEMLQYGDIRNDGLPIQDYFNKNRHRLDYGYVPDEFVIWGGDTIGKDKNTVLFHHSVAVGIGLKGKRGNVDAKLEQMDHVRKELQSKI